MNNSPLVSVVIPTYNSEKTMSKCLDSINLQSYSKIEIILVDKFSTDKTVDMAKKYPNVKVYQEGTERTYQKNIGIKHAKGAYVCFIDSDMVLQKGVISESVRLLESEKDLNGIIIPEKSIGDSFWVNVRDFERSFYTDTYVASARFFKLKLVKMVKGFDEDIIAYEEASIPRKIEKLGYKKYKSTSSEILHLEYGFSLYKWLKKKYYYGKSAKNYSKRYNNEQFSPSYRIKLFLGDRRFYTKPILAFGVIILKGLEYTSISLGSISTIKSI